MKKLFFTILVSICMLVVAGNASAAIVLTPTNGLIDMTGLINAVSNYGGSIYDGASFTDSGTIDHFTGYYPWTLYTGLAGSWSNLMGTVSFDDPYPNTDVLSFAYTSGTATLTVNGVDAALLTLINGSGSYALDTQTGAVDLLFSASLLLPGGAGQFVNGSAVAYTSDTFEDLLFAMNFDTNQAIVDFPGGTISLVNTSGDLRTSLVPEPASMLLFGSGLFGLVGAGIKKRKLA
ncbi:MAG: hypothetical protein A2447_00870 [Omnitrophica WOR_2 bacterium RIFOXYC2_FULL_38_12]|nr:MAG: hypothetical protein A2447_00870 [Omnitrophica WOR_2 bacterium RIFOXYC2_FULL_38_12]